MAKKKEVDFKSILNEFVTKSIKSVIQVVAEHSSHIIDWIKVLPRIRRKVRHILTAVALSLAGIVVLALGISDLLAFFFPNLRNGISHIIVGAFLILVALLYVKME